MKPGAILLDGLSTADCVLLAGNGVLTPTNTASLAAFNPFTTTPVLGTNWNYGANFNTPLNRFAFESPRTFQLTFGVRF